MNHQQRALIAGGLSEYQSISMSTAVYKHPLIYPGLKIAGEAGECAEKVGKLLRDHDGVVTDEFRQDLKKEIGDVLWYCAALARDLGLNLGDVAIGNVEKLQDRMQRGVLGGSGDNR